LIPAYDYHLRCWEDHRLKGDKLIEKQDLNDAEVEFKSAVAEAEHFGPADFRLCYSLNRLADLYFKRGDYQNVETASQRALAACKNQASVRSTDSGLPAIFAQEESLSLLRLAELRLKEERFKEAGSLFGRAIVILESLWHSHSLSVVDDLIGEELATALSGLALANYALGNAGLAEQHLSKALSVVSQLAAANQLKSVIRTQYEVLVQRAGQREAPRSISSAGQPECSSEQNTSFKLESLLDKIEVAIKDNQLSQAEQLLAKLNGNSPEPLDYKHRAIHLCTKLGDTYESQKQPERAANFYRKAIVLARQSGRSAELELALALQKLGDLYNVRDNPEIAIQFYEEALRILSSNLNNCDFELSWPVSALSSLYSRLGKHAKSEQLLLKRLHGLTAQPGRDPLKLAETLSAISFNCQKQGKMSDAVSCTQQALSIYEKENATSNPNYTFGHYFLGLETERNKDAEKELYHLSKALENTQRYRHLNMDGHLHCLSRLKELALQRKDKQSCLLLAAKTKSLLIDWIKAHRQDSPQTREYPFYLRWIGNLLVDEGKLDLAESYYREAIDIQRKILPKHDPDLVNSLAMLANAYHWNHKEDLGLSAAKEMLTICRETGLARDATVDLILSDFPALKSFGSDHLHATR
jgi:tetratricopeptide (TPR) repeat protein